MFWSGNYIAVRELNFLLKEENVSLTQVLEADDILQECKADNKALIQFLTKPEVLAELITLITEEPPQNVELASQYRHASIACEVLTSHLSTLADRLSLDTVQMDRLCDFINREPPLNPLLASYFSKTIEMLLERSPKQDWYLYHIVCLRVLDFLRSRRSFLPNLLRHVATSAIADTFKYLLRLEDLFNKIVMEWLDEHQFLESLIQIICGSYTPEPLVPRSGVPRAPAGEVGDVPTTEGGEQTPVENSIPAPPAESPTNQEEAQPDPVKMAAEARWRAVAAANAAALLCDLILTGCAGEGCTTRLRTVWVLVSRLQSEEWVRALLGGMFTSPPAARPAALVHGCQALLALLSTDPILAGQSAAERTSVELAVAPHLPLLHQALLHTDHGGGGAPSAVGGARVQVAALLAQLALSEVEDVPTTMITLGTPGTLVDLFFRHPDNNFLHAEVYALVKHALSNRAYCQQYANHLFIECDLLTRLMDAYEENEQKRPGVPRAGYMGHVTLLLRRCARALETLPPLDLPPLPPTLAARWAAFVDPSGGFAQRLHRHDTPLGGYYPSENIYEVDNMTDLVETLEANYEFNDMGGNELGDDVTAGSTHEFGEPAEGGDAQTEGNISNAVKFLELANERFDEDMWDDSPEEEWSGRDARDVLEAVAPWDSAPSEPSGGDDWAQFAAPPADPFAAPLAPVWPSTPHTSDIPDDVMRLSRCSISDTFPQVDNAGFTASSVGANEGFDFNSEVREGFDDAGNVKSDVFDNDAGNVGVKEVFGNAGSVENKLFDDNAGNVVTNLFDSNAGSVATNLFDSNAGSEETKLFDGNAGTVKTKLFDDNAGNVNTKAFDVNAVEVESKEIPFDNVETNLMTKFSNTDLPNHVANESVSVSNVEIKHSNITADTKTDNRVAGTETVKSIDNRSELKFNCDTKEIADIAASNKPNSDVTKVNLDVDNNTLQVTDSAEKVAPSIENVTVKCETNTELPESVERNDS